MGREERGIYTDSVFARLNAFPSLSSTHRFDSKDGKRRTTAKGESKVCARNICTHVHAHRHTETHSDTDTNTGTYHHHGPRVSSYLPCATAPEPTSVSHDCK